MVKGRTAPAAARSVNVSQASSRGASARRSSSGMPGSCPAGALPSGGRPTYSGAMSVTSELEAATVVRRLAEGLPPEALVTDPDLLESYRYDRARFCPAGVPAAVVLARETAHVQHALRTASELRVPVVPQGARSGLSGAANAIDGCIVVSTEKMRRVVEVDVANRLVVTQPGIYNAELSRAVAEHGLFYPPDPSSWEFCSIGGDLPTKSRGLCCVEERRTLALAVGLVGP